MPLLNPDNEHGRRRMCLMDKRGFPCANPKQAKVVKDFQTGDLVQAAVTMSKKVGTYVGWVAVSTAGSFDITTKAGTILWISHRFSMPIHSSDGYSYQ